jgi:predicted MFS family arabinose efflux permease
MIDRAGFSTCFLAIAALPVLAWLAVRRVVDPEPAPLEAGKRRGTAWSLWHDAGLRRLLVVTCMLSCSWDVHAFLVPVLGHERGLSASVIGSILGGFGLGATAVRLLAPMVAAQLREWIVLSTAMTAAAIVFGLYPLMHAPLSMGVCSALLGLSLGSTQPVVMSLLHRLAPEHRYGEAVAMRLIVNNASSVGIPMVSGLAGALIGAGGVFWAAGLMVAAGARLTVGLRGHAPH